MAEPITIKYSKSISLYVETADNRIEAFLSPDVPGGSKSAQVFSYDCQGFGGNPRSSMDLTDSVKKIGKPHCQLVLIGSNFSGPGRITFSVIPDNDKSKAIHVNANPASFTSQQWAYQLEKD